MPKIVHILPGKANPDRLNGVNKVVFSLASQAVLQNHPVEVWGLTSSPSEQQSTPFPLRLFQSYRRPFKIDLHILAAIDKQPADTYFHFHGVMTLSYVPIIRHLVHTKRPYVITPHGALLPLSLRRGAWYKRPYIWAFEKFNLQHAAGVHVITSEEQSAVTALYSSAKTVLIPNGTEPVDRIPIAPQNDQPVFLYMGRFAKEHKGLDILLETFTAFWREYQRGQLILAGGGPDQDWLRRFVRDHALSDCVQILPPQFGNDRGALLAKIDIFVHSSRWDVMPTGCLEAAAHAKPLLVAQQTGLGDFVTSASAGWSVASTDPKIWADALYNVVRDWDNGLTAPMGQNAARAIQTDLSWDRLLPRFYRDLYIVRGPS